MDDVIFSGSGNRPARNTAEVTLVLDNSDRTAPAALNNADVLEVTRRIEREEGSVYRVNGKEVRARDVQLLFADASTGAHSPALVRQGQIGELIAAKPTAAAGAARRGRGHFGAPFAAARGRAAAAGGGAESRARRRRHQPGDAAARTAEAPGAAGDPLSRDQRRHPQGRGDAVPHPLDRARAAEKETEAEQGALVSQLADAQHVELEAQKVVFMADQAVQPLRDKEAAAGAALQRLTILAEQLAEEARRAEQRRAELTQRIEQTDGRRRRASARCSTRATKR